MPCNGTVQKTQIFVTKYQERDDAFIALSLTMKCHNLRDHGGAGIFLQLPCGSCAPHARMTDRGAAQITPDDFVAGTGVNIFKKLGQAPILTLGFL